MGCSICFLGFVCLLLLFFAFIFCLCFLGGLDFLLLLL